MCVLRVHGADLALTLYYDALRLELRCDVANEGFRSITVDAATQPVVPILLRNYQTGSPTDGEAIAALLKGVLTASSPTSMPHWRM